MDTLFGHTFHVRVHVACELDALYGWTMDFADIKTVFQQVGERLDHHNISEELSLSDNRSLADYLVTELRLSGIPMSQLDVQHNPGQGIVINLQQ